jgi:HEAT repeat protein
MEGEAKVMTRSHRTFRTAAGVLGALVIVSIGVWVWLVVQYPGIGPVHEGRRLSVWMDQYREHWRQRRNPADFEKAEAARQAVMAIGAEAVPTLLQMVAAKDSRFTAKAKALLRKQQIIKLELHPPNYLQAKATTGFALLGQTARPAIPGLIELLSDSDREVRAAAAHCLSFFGPEAREAIPHLIKLLDDTGNGYGPILLNAMHSLGSIQEDPETVVPFLLYYVTGGRAAWGYRQPALEALSRYRERAAEAVPSIVPLLRDPDKQVSEAADTALSWIDPEGTLRRSLEQEGKADGPLVP